MNGLQIGLMIFGQFLFTVLLVWLLLSIEPPKPKPEPVPSPADVAALMDEARRITG
jgi:hypothetical protein